jgi:hypothetical protein
MVKNTKGGKGAKSMARKLTTSFDSHSLRIPTSPLELFAVVSKILGNGMCHVITKLFDKPLLCHIRNKFSGRSKRNNFIGNNSVILIGLRDWEEPNFKNCDLLEIYDTSSISILSSLPSFDINHLINPSTTSYHSHDELEFTNTSEITSDFDIEPIPNNTYNTTYDHDIESI